MKTQIVLCALLALTFALVDARFGEARESLDQAGDAGNEDGVSLDSRNVQDAEEDEQNPLMKRGEILIRGKDYQYGCYSRTFNTTYTCHPQLPGIGGSTCCLTSKDTVITLTACTSLKRYGCYEFKTVRGRIVSIQKVGNCVDRYNGYAILKTTCPNGKTYRVRVHKFVSCACMGF